MPRFHLNVFNDYIALDEEGIERSSLDEAKVEAIRGVRELIADDIMAGKPVHQSHRVEVTDERGTVLHVVRFGDMIVLQH